MSEYVLVPVYGHDDLPWNLIAVLKPAEIRPLLSACFDAASVVEQRTSLAATSLAVRDRPWRVYDATVNTEMETLAGEVVEIHDCLLNWFPTADPEAVARKAGWTEANIDCAMAHYETHDGRLHWTFNLKHAGHEQWVNRIGPKELDQMEAAAPQL